MKLLPWVDRLRTILVGSLAAVGGACATAEPTEVAALDDELSSLHALTADAPDDFAGLTIDEEANRATLFVVGSRQTRAMRMLQERLTHTPDAIGRRFAVEHRMVARSQDQLDNIQAAITADHQWVSEAGAELREWGPNIEDNVIELGVDEITPELEAAAQQRFGDAVVLREVQRNQVRSRVTDSPPWFGGIDLRNPNGGSQCTSGWAVEKVANPAEAAMTTAGHCYPLSERVMNGTRTVGTMVWPIWEHRGLDIGFITGSTYAATIYHGPFNTNTSAAVKSWIINPTVGMNVCTGGAVTGSVCTGGIKITHRNSCVRFDNPDTGQWWETCGLSRAYSTQLQFISQRGDSGGHVYVPVTGGVSAVGSQVGGKTADEVWFHEVATFMPSGWRLRTR